MHRAGGIGTRQAVALTRETASLTGHHGAGGIGDAHLPGAALTILAAADFLGAPAGFARAIASLVAAHAVEAGIETVAVPALLVVVALFAVVPEIEDLDLVGGAGRRWHVDGDTHQSAVGQLN